MFQGQLTGSGSYTERKQRLFLSSYHGRVKPWGCNQRRAPCARTTLTGFSRFTETLTVSHLFVELEPSQASAHCAFRKEGIYLHICTFLSFHKQHFIPSTEKTKRLSNTTIKCEIDPSARAHQTAQGCARSPKTHLKPSISNSHGPHLI